MDQVGGAVVKRTPEALLAGGEAEGESDMRLADAARGRAGLRSRGARDVLAAGEIQHQHLVERRDRLEVEALELFDDRETQPA